MTGDRWGSKWILAAVSIALFCVQIDYFAVNLALPRIAADLDTTTTDLQWVISVYMLTLGAFMVPAGRIGDIFGRRRALLAGIALFGVASVGCAIAPDAGLLIAARAVQGIGAALIFPVSVSVLTNAYSAQESSRAIGLAYGIAGLGNAAGPVVGGVLTDTLGWRAVFWLLVPFAVVSLILGALAVPETFDHTVPRRLDLPGLALITSGVGLFTLTVDRAPSWGWTSTATVGAFAAAVALLAVFVVVERHTRWPLLDLSLLNNGGFVVLVAAGTVANVAYAVTVFLSTLNLQQVRGLTPLVAGLLFLGPSAGAALGGVVSGRLAARRSPIAVMGTGCTAAAVALGSLAAANNSVVYVAALTACGFTMGLVYAFTTVATQAVVAPERAGGAAGVTLTFLVTVAGVGIAVAGTALEALQDNGFGTGSGINTILAIIAAPLLVAGLVVLSRSRSRRS
ncbi:EmrB/QacA subfamily drug resistance transporter [Mycobacterium sp. BK086]|uniref:MFS transporter n=1 Tax=Mycobacterium sp. BK086 TaxID=2512165 RepID=UPI00105F60EB|nr:MFS transporter [Mycobacterium sp. BK086]TDO17912.1 EmrB/QacA subfamily drug resistance transporter [Mycobacterium sp. BK086]